MPEKDSHYLRAQLATDRTMLSTERTMLGYIRTSLTAIAVGISMVKFFNELVIKSVGWFFITGAAALFLVGLAKYRKRKTNILKNFRLSKTA